MRVLLLAQAFPPYPIVGAIRPARIAAALRARGHQVLVVTERLAGEQGGLRVDEPTLQVHPVAVGLPYRLRLVGLLDRLRRRRPAGAAPPAAAPASSASPHASAPAAAPPRPGFARRLMLSLLWFPDDEQRFILPALRAARALIPRGVDVVYTTAPSFSTHVVGLLLRRRGGVRWVAEFRDPWTDQRGEDSYGRVPAVEALHRWLERRCLLRADVVVAVTAAAGEALAAKLPAEQRGKVVVALNGIESLDDPRTGARTGPFRIVYAGTFYHHRDPRSFLDALAAVRRRTGFGPADVRVDFVGRCREYDGVSVEALVEHAGLGDVVHFHDWLPQAEAQAMQRDADLLFLIARNQPLQVPNKLYDYLGTNVPILAWVDADGESDRMLRRAGGHHVVTGESREEFERVLDAAMAGRVDQPPAADRDELLREWSTERQLHRLIGAIGVA